MKKQLKAEPSEVVTPAEVAELLGEARRLTTYGGSAAERVAFLSQKREILDRLDRLYPASRGTVSDGGDAA